VAAARTDPNKQIAMSRIKKILCAYLACRQPRSLREEFADWFQSPYDSETKQRLLREYWDALTPDMLQEKVDEAYFRLSTRMGLRGPSARRAEIVPRVRRRRLFAAAAVIAAAVVSALLYAAGGWRGASVQWREIYAPYGQTRSVVLADGSQIVINSGSRLIYPDRFVGRERRVFLCGEAYAEVAKDGERRFVLSADDVDVLVHGTAFRIRSYVSDSEVEVALLSGTIDMQTKNLQQNCLVEMTPGDMVRLDKRTEKVALTRFPAGAVSGGMDRGRLTFINLRLSDIALQLERAFDAKIVIDTPDLADERYYSVFINHESLEEILSALQQNGDMRHRREEGIIHLYRD